METAIHRPVLLQETVAALGCRPGGLWVDGTVGTGGHAEAILQATAPHGRLLGCDRDGDALRHARWRLRAFGDRIILRHADFRGLATLLDEIPFKPIDGLLLDLGLSSLQVDDPQRGFSFRHDGPLDMRMDRRQMTTARSLVNRLPERELGAILKRFGEEPAARRIARAIARAREAGPIATTGQLKAIVVGAVPRRRATRVHPATRAFQALRIAVNDELRGLEEFLEVAALRLRANGRIAVIAFHSLEDRLVKRTLRGLAHRCRCPRHLPICGCGQPDLLRLVTVRAVRPGPQEVSANPRSRSARLRAAERLEVAA